VISLSGIRRNIVSQEELLLQIRVVQYNQEVICNENREARR